MVPSLGNGLTVPILPADYPALLESLRCPDLPAAGTEFLVGWDGVRTRIAMLPFAPDELAGTVSVDLPIPDDGYRSEAVEYVCLAQALATAKGSFQIVEIGAGWAPWSVAAIVQGRRRGLQVTATAVEADPQRAGWALRHAEDNGIHAELISGDPDEIAQHLAGSRRTAELMVVQAAGWHTRTTVQFPALDEGDMGGAVWTLPGTDVDYRGAHLDHHDVPTVSMADLLASGSLTDLLHVDVQGVEFELVEATVDTIQAHTRYLAIGTTDRYSEGRLQNLLLPRGWGLAIDDPCTAIFTMTHPTLPGFTVQDGTQLWENPFLREDVPR